MTRANNPVRDDGTADDAARPPLVSAHELLEAVPDAIVGVDGRGDIAFVNRQAERMFGYSRTEMLGCPVELLMPAALRDAHVGHRAAYVASPATREMGVGLDLVARRKDGSDLPVEVGLSPLRTAGAPMVVAIVRDVSERRAILEHAQVARRQAEEALRLRTEVDALRSDLTNMVVHDLKNPLSGISMMVQLALRKGGAGLAEPVRRHLRQIDRSCSEMMRLVLNLLEISKIEAGEMPVVSEPVRVAAVVDELYEEYGGVAEEVGRRLVASVPDTAYAMADRALFKRVLVNLVVNALRHSGSPEVRVESTVEPESRGIVVRVVDLGRGIPLEEQARLFEKFRSRRGDRTMDTGLGLPFCKLAVERMGGRIDVSSSDGGTTFAIALPAVSAGATA
jgi:PAS domain S-box-containing protein